MVCAQKGYPLVVTMSETFSVERRKLMRFLGAKVVLTPAAGRGLGMVSKAIELADAHGWFLTRQFENEANADMHSRTTAKEILEDFKGERLDYTLPITGKPDVQGEQVYLIEGNDVAVVTLTASTIAPLQSDYDEMLNSLVVH